MNSPWASQHGSGERWALQRAAAKLEWVWPLPLLVAGVAGVHEPLTAGVAGLLALVPWIARILGLAAQHLCQFCDARFSLDWLDDGEGAPLDDRLGHTHMCVGVARQLG